MPINWKKVIIASSGSVVIGYVLYQKLLYRDLYKRLPSVDRKIVREAYRRTCKNAAEGKYNASQLSTDEIYMLILDQVEEMSHS